MHFEHLIEINDPLNPLIDILSRQQLWQGLVLRAESPKLFIPHLDECVLQVAHDGLTRRLRYGELVVHDRVTFYPQQQIVYEVAAQNEITQSRLCMSIEEPVAGHLYVRFQYSDANGEAQDAANAMYDDFRRSAYKEADIDTISIIRRLAEQGQLNLC
jgi:hypothetical protein